MSLHLEISSENSATEYFNYTYNVSSMWYEIFPEDEGMVSIEGMTGKEAQHKMGKAVTEMIKHEGILRELEPKNGKGSYEGFLCFLMNVLEACIRHPDGTWEAHR